MEEKVIEIGNKKFLHVLHTDKFKTSFVAAFFLSDLKRENVTINALIPAVLTRGTNSLPTIKDINLKLDGLYGASMDGSSDKIGDKQALQFYITTIDDKYALNNEKLLEESIKLLLNVIYSPKLVDGKFDESYVKGEKENLRELIKARINDKSSYAVSRLVEEMFKDSPYGVYKYGNLEDIDSINSNNLYQQYLSVISNSEVHFYVVSSANVDKKWFDICNKKIDDEKNIVEEIQHDCANEIFTTPLNCRKGDASLSCENEILEPSPNCVIEHQDVTQGKLVLGYDVDINKTEDLYKMQVYNAILGGSSNSKMFQNVREKESLAYTARSMYLKHKATLIVFAGIEINKYDKALTVIEEQLEDMKTGNFSDEDIKDAKVFLENLMRSYKDSQDVLIDLSMGQIVMGMKDDIETIIQKINSVSRENILYVASKVKLNTKYFLTGKEE